jgi:hypothetical protein
MQTNTTGPAQQDQHNRTSTTGPAQQDQQTRIRQHNQETGQDQDKCRSRRFKFQVAVVQARRTVRDRGGLGSGLSKSQPLGGGPRVPYEGSSTPMAAA